MNFKLFLSQCCCILTKANVFNIKPWQADLSTFSLFQKKNLVP